MEIWIRQHRLASGKHGGEATTPPEANNIARGSDTTFDHEPVPPWKFPREDFRGRARARATTARARA